MTVSQVMELREKASFVSPWGPVIAGKPEVMFSQRGTYEWLMHPDDAFHALAFGMVVDGKTLECSCVDVFPFLGALMIRAKDPGGNLVFSDGTKK